MIENQKQMMEGYDAVIKDMREITVMKSNDYGVRCWQELGEKGVFADLNRKYWRIKNLVWDGNPAKVKDEKVYDTVIDMANHCIQMAILIKMKGEK